MFIANELSWNILNTDYLCAMIVATVETFQDDNDDMDAQLRDLDIMFSMQ